jgi:hypothetical protein
LHEKIHSVAVMIHRLPEVMALPVDGQQDLIEVTVVTWSGTPPTSLMDIHLPELPAPKAHGLKGWDNSTLQPQPFDIPNAQTKAKVEPHPVADDSGGKTMAIIRVGYGWWGHTASMPHQPEQGNWEG